MKALKYWMAGAAFALACDLAAAEPKPAASQSEKSLTTQKEKASYGVGMNVGKSFKSDLIDLDTDAFVRGFKDALAGANPAVTEEDLEKAITAMRDDVARKSGDRIAANKKAGQEFLAKNKADNKDVKVTESGLQYVVLKEGTGPTPKPTDTVKVHYRGTLVDGTEFDSSYKSNKPATFPVNQVIPGWTEALQKMKVGSKWKVVIPSEIAYGDQGQPPVIPPAATLIFEIELLSIEKS
jgi:FKBP-type peptidyl-prolyl cis-trans isomerase FklB